MRMKLLKPLQPLLTAPVFTWEYILVALLLASVLGRAIAGLHASFFSQKYSQLAVGDITWGAGTKSPDYLLLLGFVVTFLLIYPGLQLFSTSLKQQSGSAVEQSFRHLLLYALIPTGLWLGIICFNNDPTIEFILISTALVLLAILFSWVLKARRWVFESEEDHTACVGSSLLIILLAFFSGIGLLLAISRLHLGWQPGVDAGWIAAAVTGVLALGGLIQAWWGRSASPTVLLHKLRLRLGLAQIFLPLCFFILLPTPWTDGQQRFYGYPLTPLLYGFIGLLVLASYIDLGWRLFQEKRSPSPAPVFSVLSPLCLVALLVLLKSPTVGPPNLVADDYHWGEFLLPWWLWQTFHYLPFQDYEPARGLVNYVPGLLANLFMNGNATSYIAVAGRPIMFPPFLLIGFLGMAPAIGLLPAFLALLIMPSPGGLFEIDVLVSVQLCLLGVLFGRQRWLLWLGVWLLGGLALILFAPGNGGLSMMATAPIAALVFYKAIRQSPGHLLRAAIVTLVGLPLLVGLTPLGAMLGGALRYGAEQSSVNSVAYGVEWFKSRGSHTFLSYSLWEFVRTSWIVISVAIGLIIYQVCVTREPRERLQFLAYALPIFLITLLLIPRSAGRIDPGNISRLGNTSIWVACLLLPIVLIQAYGRRGMAPSLLVVAIVGGLLGLSVDPGLSLQRVALQPVATVDVENLTFTDGKQVGMPVLDGAIVEPAHLQHLQQLKAVLGALLQPGETYLDLTSHNAHYFYLGYPPPIETGAVYNLVHKNQILRAVERLQKTLPPVVLASADSTAPTNNTSAVRSHLLYRFVAERYIPVAVDQMILMVRPDRLDRLKNLGLNQNVSDAAIANEAMPTVAIGVSDPLRLSLLDQIFRLPNLDSLASAWGQSFNSLQPEIKQVKTISATVQPTLQEVQSLKDNRYRVTGANPRLTFDLSSLNLKGRDAGLLAFDFACTHRRKATFPIRWESQPSNAIQANQVQIKALNGKQLVPLDASPRWLLAEHIKTLQFALTDTACPEFFLANITLYQRADVAKMPH
jgi:hypothetical protein